VRKLLWTGAAAASLLAILAWATLRYDSVPMGLTASYEALGGPARTIATTDSQPTTERTVSIWGDPPPDAFNATWRGIVYVPQDGPYAFATRADGESAIYLDGRKILENGWSQPDMTVRETVRPDAGPHNLAINYIHNGGPIHIEVLWARGDEPLVPIPPEALRQRRVTAAHFTFVHAMERAARPLKWLAIALLLAASALGSVGPLTRYLARWGAPPALAWVLVLSGVLNIVGITWGSDGIWGVLEVTPSYVLGAVDARFMHGWSHAYPAFHFMILALVTSPFIVLDALGRISVHEIFWIQVMLLVSRVVTLVMAAGTLVAIYVTGARVFNARSGVAAAAIFALAAPFVYFAKMANVDVPYVFWFAVALTFYVALLHGDRTRDYIGLAVAAALSVCTKDQAYGLFFAMPLALLVSKGINRKMILAGAVSVAVFLAADNVIFNYSGFVEHVKFIVGDGNTAYRAYEPTLAGRLQLLWMTLRAIKWTWGWPLLLACVAGIPLAASRAGTRRATIWLLIVPVSYYLSFINVILYVYDRFTMPIALVLALFGGFAVDRLLATAPGRAARLAVGAAFAYTILYSSTVDVLMLRDSRYAVERWLAHQTLAAPNDMVASNIHAAYLPRLTGYRYGHTLSVEELQLAQPKFFILDADYLRGEPPDSPLGSMVVALEQHKIGYTKVLTARTPSPWPWLPDAHPALTGDRLDAVFVSNLLYINPTIEVFQHDTTIVR
jgi:hypothetical protein